MEVKGGWENKGYVLLFECIGTANLLYAINSSSSNGDWLPFAVGLTIFGNICIFGEVSGGHFNPAVTIGVLIAEGSKNLGRNIVFAAMIILAQIVGAILGCMSSYLAQYYNNDVKGVNMNPKYKLGLNPGIAHLAPPFPDASKYDVKVIPSITRGGLEAFWSEMILTALFVGVILSAKYLNGATDLFLNALIIGFTLFTCILTGKSVSGGCYNPAVGLVQIPF